MANVSANGATAAAVTLLTGETFSLRRASGAVAPAATRAHADARIALDARNGGSIGGDDSETLARGDAGDPAEGPARESPGACLQG
jgi:hypothetical protein